MLSHIVLSLQTFKGYFMIPFKLISLKNKNKLILLYISFILFILDIIFISINYSLTKKTLNTNLLQRAQTHQEEFNLTLQMTYRNMLQISTFISQNKELNQLFLQGKKAVEKEGGGAGGQQAQQARQQLLNKIKTSWDYMTKEFNIRQLHYQLGPGSLSFLRVHKPEKFGDRMDDLRHIIVATNAEKTIHTGFETGRIYSGLRGVSPVWATDPNTDKKVYVGALEVGTSFKQILPIITRLFHVNASVLLTKQHIENKMWPQFIIEYFNKNPNINYYLEATTSPNTKNMLSALSIQKDFITLQTSLIEEDSRYLSAYYFPLRDYRGTQNKALPPSGFILMWEDVTPLVHAFKHNFMINIALGIIGFLFAQIGLIWIFNRENKLLDAKQNALTDGLTKLFNRRYFDSTLQRELSRAKRYKEPLSLIVCDIDFFKVYNDTYGHKAGDECLKKIAQILPTQIKRSSDFVARYGGEEFVIVLPQTNLKSAINLAKKANKAIYSLQIPHKNSATKPVVTLTLGVACTQNLEEGADLFETADKNLYLAKNSGRNRVEPDI